VIREAVREAVQLAAGNKTEAVRRFRVWLIAGGQERVLAFYEEIGPHVPMTLAMMPKFGHAVADVIAEIEDERWAYGALEENLDHRENPSLHRDVQQEIKSAIERYLAQLFEEELDRYRRGT
jgi:hypothetical protein